MLQDAALMDLCARLVGTAGRAQPTKLERLAGGRNNRVYRATLADGSAAVLKCYHADPRDPRDRLGAEWSFLTYAWQRGVRNAPEPLAHDTQAHAGLYSFLPGSKLSPGQVTDRHMQAAAAFVCAVNAAPLEPQRLGPGSEACFSLAAHIAAVDRRVTRLEALDPQAPGRENAESFVSGRLRPTWADVRQKIERDAEKSSLELEAEIAPEEICVSPSDFGFHNALVEGDRIAFLDFEYAGRDDPAKLVCDFFCQPEVPAPIGGYDDFLQRLEDGLELKDARLRCDLLLDAYRIKWVCIILNEFLPMDAARRAFADEGGAEERYAAQLAKAVERIEDIRAA